MGPVPVGPQPCEQKGPPDPDREDRQNRGGEFRAVCREGEGGLEGFYTKSSREEENQNKQMGGPGEVI